MKSYLDLVFLLLVAAIGFILPWWTLFILSFAWSYFRLARPTKIMVAVFFVHFVIIFLNGRNLIAALNFSDPAFKALVAPLVSFLFGGACYFVASSAQEMRKILKNES